MKNKYFLLLSMLAMTNVFAMDKPRTLDEGIVCQVTYEEGSSDESSTILVENNAENTLGSTYVNEKYLTEIRVKVYKDVLMEDNKILVNINEKYTNIVDVNLETSEGQTVVKRLAIPGKANETKFLTLGEPLFFMDAHSILKNSLTCVKTKDIKKLK